MIRAAQPSTVTSGLRLSPHLRVEVLSPGSTRLLSDAGEFYLSGALNQGLLTGLAEDCQEEALIDLLGPVHGYAQVYYALGRLERQGFLDRTGAPPQWSQFGLDPEQLARRSVEIEALGGLGPGTLESALTGLGCRVQDGRCDLVVVLTDDYLRSDLEDLDRRMRERGQAWMPVRPVGARLWVGPVFVPGRTACWNCLAARLRQNRHPHTPTETGTLPTMRTLADQLAATRVAAWLAGPDPEALEQHMLTYEVVGAVGRSHPCSRLPHCPACGDAGLVARRALEPPRLQSAPVAHREGGHRTFGPAETERRVEHLISPLTGVLKSIEGLEEQLLPVHAVTYANPALPGAGVGKGASRAQSRVSALGEALERLSARFHGDELCRRARLDSLAGAIHPNQCMLFSQAQYAGRDRPAGDPRFEVRRPLDPSQELEWSPIWSLTHQSWRWLPSEYLYLGYPSRVYCHGNSNGLAAGNCLEEAVLQGVLELIERDSLAIWWYNRLTRPALDLGSFQEPYVDALVRLYRDQGREVWVLDLTFDLGIPTCVALSRRLEGTEEVLLGVGCHLDPTVALVRALTELNQTLVGCRYQPPAPRLSLAESYLRPAPATPTTLAGLRAQAPAVDSDLYCNITAIQARLEAQGLELLVADLSRPDLTLSVVRVVVPGLRHHWPRFAPGRLFEVPVRLGLLSEPTAEADLNPLPWQF